MSRNDAARLADIGESCEIIARYIRDLNLQTFAEDQRTFDAVVRRFEIIGEAVKLLSPELTQREPAIPWRQIAGFRDVLAHAYFAVEASIVWDASTAK